MHQGCLCINADGCIVAQPDCFCCAPGLALIWDLRHCFSMSMATYESRVRVQKRWRLLCSSEFALICTATSQGPRLRMHKRCLFACTDGCIVAQPDGFRCAPGRTFFRK